MEPTPRFRMPNSVYSDQIEFIATVEDIDVWYLTTWVRAEHAARYCIAVSNRDWTWLYDTAVSVNNVPYPQLALFLTAHQQLVS